MSKKPSAGRTIVFVLFCLWLVVQIYPLVFMVISAFKTESEIAMTPFSLPKSLYLENFIKMWTSKTNDLLFSHYFVNSIIVTVISLFLLCVVALLAGYAIARLDFPGRNFLYIICICLIAVPTQALIVPLYNLYEKLHITNNAYAMIPLYASFSLPFSIFIMKTNIETIPMELEEAAMIDGCNRMKTFIHIIVPMSRVSIVTIAIINMVGIWSELLYATVFLVRPESRTLPVVIDLLKPGLYQTERGPMMAALFVATIPILIIYFIFQKQIVKGMTAGAIK